MSKYTDQLNEHITTFLSDIHKYRTRIQELEESVKDLKKEITNQKSLARKYRTEKNVLKKKLEAVKKGKSEE